MNKTIRKTAAILAHIGLLVSILYLGFFIICSLRAQKADSSAPDQKDLSDENDPVRENLFIAADLVVPLLCLASGILLQLAIVKPHRTSQKNPPSQSTKFRR